MVVNMGMNPENYYYQHPFKDEWICGETFHTLAGHFTNFVEL